MTTPMQAAESVTLDGAEAVYRLEEIRNGAAELAHAIGFVRYHRNNAPELAAFALPGMLAVLQRVADDIADELDDLFSDAERAPWAQGPGATAETAASDK